MNKTKTTCRPCFSCGSEAAWWTEKNCDKVKADTWYTLKDGELVEVEKSNYSEDLY